MSKDNKFQHKWLFDPKIAFCDKSHKWCLTYIDGKGMFCALCRIYNTKQSNDLKVWNSTANLRCRTETIRQHFQSKSSIHIQAVGMDSQKKKNPTSLKKRKSKKNSRIPFTKQYSKPLLVGKEGNCKHQNYISSPAFGKGKCLGDKNFQTRSEPVLKAMLIILSSTIIEGLTKRIKNSKCFGLLTDEVTDISNVEVTDISNVQQVL